MLLDPLPQLRQRQDLTVREGGSVFASGELDPFGTAARTGHDGDALVSQAPLDDLSGRGVRDEVVRVDHPRDDGFAEARARVYDCLPALPGDRVRGEQDPSDRRVDHPLHGDCEAHAVWVDPVRSPVAYGAVRPQRGPAASHRVDDRLCTDHIQIRVLLARKARVRQVLGRGRGTDGHGHAVSQISVRHRNSPRENVRDSGI